jgi:hypothetical protein
MANERITEDVARNHFKNDPLFKSIKFEEQKSYSKRVIDETGFWPADRLRELT